MYEMNCFGFPTGPGGYAEGRILPTSQGPGLGGHMIRSGSYMGSIGRTRSLRVAGVGSSRATDLAAIGLGTGLGATPVDTQYSLMFGTSGDKSTSSSGSGWQTALDFFTVAVQGAPGIINAARDDSASAVVPVTSTGPGASYYQAELDRLRAQQVAAAGSVGPAAPAPASIIPGISNGMLLIGIGVLGIGAAVTVSLLKRSPK